MALWTLNPPQQEDIYTVVYFLKDTLSSALEDAWFFERTALPKVDVKGLATLKSPRASAAFATAAKPSRSVKRSC